MTSQLRHRLLLGIALGVAVISALFLLSDTSAILEALRAFNWWLLPVVLGLVVLNYVLRFFKWQFYLGESDIEELNQRDSVWIYVSGFSMAMTPGKVGELLKAYLVRTRAGTPITRTAPIVFCERVTDGAGMLVLAGIGLFTFRFGWPFFLVGVLIFAALLIFVQNERRVRQVLERLRGTRLGYGRIDGIEEMYYSTRTLLAPRPFLKMLTLSSSSWFFECIALYVVLIGLGLPHSWFLVLASIFVFSTSAWIGGISMLPGGLGATDASAAALLLLTIDDPSMTSAVAATATLLIRFATLWFGVFIGLAALVVTLRWNDSTVADSAKRTKEELPAS
jgi:uncharacterized protein (TIRG00374 family)